MENYAIINEKVKKQLIELSGILTELVQDQVHVDLMIDEEPMK